MNGEEIRIMRARKEDIPVLLDLMMALQRFEHAFSERVRCDAKTKAFFEETFLAKRLEDPDYRFFIAWKNGKPIGMISGWKEYVSLAYKNEYVGYICQLIILPEFRRMNAGKKLVERIISEFKRMGIKEVKAEVLSANANGRKFWKNLGLEELYIHFRGDI